MLYESDEQRVRHYLTELTTRERNTLAVRMYIALEEIHRRVSDTKEDATRTTLERITKPFFS